MRYYTHLVGACTIYLILAFILSISLNLMGLFLATWMSLFPDLTDRLTRRHRGVGHSLLWLIVLSLGLFFNVNLTGALIIGFSSHILLDCFTTYGCPLFYPLRKLDFACLNRKRRIQTGTKSEKSVLIFLLFLLIPMIILASPLAIVITDPGLDEVFASNPPSSNNNLPPQLDVNLNLRLEDGQNKNITLLKKEEAGIQVLVSDLNSSG